MNGQRPVSFMAVRTAVLGRGLEGSLGPNMVTQQYIISKMF